MALDVANLGFKVDSSALVKAKTDLDGLANAAGKATKPLDSVGDAAGRAGAGVGVLGASAGGAASAGMSRFASEARNVSFQIQDMATQLSMGTSVMTTMGQQLPQLLGGFGLWGAAIGAVVAVGAGLAPMLLNAAGEGEKLSDVMLDLAGAQAAYADAADLSRTSLMDLSAEFGSSTLQAREMYNVLRDLAMLELTQKLSETGSALNSTFGDMQRWLDLNKASLAAFNAGLRDEAASMYRQAIAGLNKELGLTVGQAEQVSAALDQINRAANATEQAEGFRQLATVLRDAAENGAKIPPELLATARAAGQAGVEALRTANAIAQASDNTGAAIANTNSWAAAMSGVAAQINAIASALSSIGGGMISRAAMFVERNALAAGKSVAQARVEVEKFKVANEWDAQIMGAKAKGGIFGTVAASALEAAKAVDLSNVSMAAENAVLVQNAQVAERAAAATGRKGKASKGAGKSAKGAAKATRDLIGELNKELDARQALIGLYGEERARVEALQQVQSKLGDDIGKYSQSAIQATADRIVAIENETEAWETQVQRMESLTDDLAGAWGDWIAGGLRDFKDFADNILKIFQRMISEMIATAAANPIRIAITGAMGGMGGPAAAGAPGMPGGAMGGFGTGIGTAISGTMSGFGSVVSGLFSGGLGGAAGALTTALGGATSGLAGLATAAGAIAAPVAAVAAVVSFFSSTTKELDRGLRVTVNGMDAVIEQYRTIEKSRFWGLSKKRRTDYDPASDEIADPIESAIGKVQQSVLDMAATLGTGSEAFADFTYQFKLSTKDMTDAEALEAIQAEIVKFGDAYAAMVPGIADFAKEGEGAYATLERLSTSLTTVNGVLADLGLQLYDMSVQGAGAAAAFADLFGGLDQFAQASSAYYEAFYSDQERLARLTEVSTQAVRDAGLAVPATREAYRQLVEAQDLSTEAGREATAMLLQLAPAFDQIYDAAESARLEAEKAIADANATRENLLLDLMTEQQRAAYQQAQIEAVFRDLNMTVPTTLEGLQAIIAALDLTSEAGRNALAEISKVADALEDQLGGSNGEPGAFAPTMEYSTKMTQAQEDLWRKEREAWRAEAGLLDPDGNKAVRAVEQNTRAIDRMREAMEALDTANYATKVDYDLAVARMANINASPAATPAAERKAQEARQAQDSETLVEMCDYMRTMCNETHRMARETRDLRMLQEVQTL